MLNHSHRWASKAFCTSALLLSCGCGGGERPAMRPKEVPHRSAAQQRAAGAPTRGPHVQDAGGPGPKDQAPEHALQDERKTTQSAPAAIPKPFPPPNFAPPHERSAASGDGEWRPVGDLSAGDRAAAKPHVLYETVVHPHPVSRFLSVIVVALDLENTSVHWAAGKDDPKGKAGAAAADPPGLVPEKDRSDVIAIFNGGFQSQHGFWGIMQGGHTFVRPRPDGCTVALYSDRSVRVRSWPVVAGEVANMIAYRQTPPCLVERGTVHSRLLAGNDRAWAGKSTDLKTRRRSALGIDATGNVLFYGLGEEVDARYLAEGMKSAGATDAAELDINWNWTRFLLVGDKPGKGAEITSALVKNMPYGRREYVSRPSSRDFFYVRRRAATP